MSHPMWVRGLKLDNRVRIYLRLQSHPMWVRGLKLRRRNTIAVNTSRTPCGCVD